MKNALKMLSLVLVVLLLTGCGGDKKKEDTTVVCKLTSTDPSASYKLEATYTINKDGKVAKSVESKEVMTSDNEEILAYLKTTLEQTYDTYNEIYGGYTSQITNENGTVTSVTKIDYTAMDLDKYVEDNTVMKSYVNDDNKLLVEGVVNIYEQMGAVCE